MLDGPSPAYEQANRVNEQRFPCTGLSCKDCKSGFKLNVELLYEGKIDNAQLGKHREESTRTLTV